MENININISLQDTAELIKEKLDQIPTFGYGEVPNYKLETIVPHYTTDSILKGVNLLFVDIPFKSGG